MYRKSGKVGVLYQWEIFREYSDVPSAGWNEACPLAPPSHSSLALIVFSPWVLVCLGNERTRVKWKTLLWENQIALGVVSRNCWGTKIFLVPFLCSFSSVQFSSVAQSCQTLCNPVDCSTPGLPVHHQLPEFTQSRVHWVGNAIQPPHPLSPPSPPAFNHSQHLGPTNESVLCIR